MSIAQTLIAALIVTGSFAAPVSPAAGDEMVPARAAEPALGPSPELMPYRTQNTPELVEVSRTRVEARLREHVFRTPYLEGNTYVRILLPVGYARHRKREYPVLLLLNGCCNEPPQARTWTDPDLGNAKAILAKQPMIIVMPDNGLGGLYTDWHQGGEHGTPRWESYHLTQLLPWVDRHYRTVDGRAGHAVAGLSMGGLGAYKYAARHPDMFVAAYSFSGIVDNLHPKGTSSSFAEGLSYLDGALPGEVWGDRTTDEVRWRAHNPWDLAPNLRGLQLSLSSGDGTDGESSTPADPVESLVRQENESVHTRLNALGIKHRWVAHLGRHTWPYWRADLRRAIPQLMNVFRDPPPAPSSFTYRAVAERFRVYDWSVALQREVLEFATLKVTNPRKFSVVGSGTAAVVTPSTFTPGRRYLVTLSTRQSTRTTALRADGRGRLHLNLDLGPSSATQQYAPGDIASLRHRTQVRVQISRTL